MEPKMKAVAAQYSKWVYPEPIVDLDKAIEGGYWEIGDPLLYWPVFWPFLRNPPQNLQILSAGCGTNQAAYFAKRFPNSKIIGIDLSDTSLDHQKFLKDKHSLHNLELQKLNILDAGSLNQKFDLITCTGVLHHMEDPVAGLAALRECLKPEGIANLMVYSYTLRTGVYMLQKAFKDLGLVQNKEDVEIIRAVISALHPEHPVHRYVKVATDLKYDGGIVDTFLHPQDRAYLAGEIFDFTRSAGLEFLSWADPSVYSLDIAIPKSHPLNSLISGLDDQKSANICDMLTQQTGTHRWFAAHPDYVKKIKTPDDLESFLNCFAFLHKDVSIEAPANVSANLSARCSRGGTSFEIPALTAETIRYLMEGSKTIREAINKISHLSVNKNILVDEIVSSLKKLHKNGHLYIFI